MKSVILAAKFLRDPLWQGIGSIASALVVIFTYLSLRQYRQKEKQIETREILETIIQPMVNDLESLIDYYILNGQFRYFHWIELKNKITILYQE